MQRRFLSILVIAILAGQIIAMSPLRAHLSTPVSLLEAEAQESEPVEEVLIERGHTSAIYDLGSNQRHAVLGLEPWVLDESTGQYVPHLIQDFGNSTVNVKSGMIGWKIGPESAVITDPELTEDRTREVWRIYLGEQELDKEFVTQSINDYKGEVRVLHRYDTEIDGNRAAITITYLIHDGRATERVVQLNGVSDDLKTQVRIEREWRDIDTDELLYSTTESQSRDEVDAERKALTTDQETGEYVRLMKEGRLIVHENLRTAGDKLKDIEYERNLVKFEYSGWESQTTVKLTDDTYSTGPLAEGYISTDSQIGTDCGSPSSKTSDPTTLFVFLAASSSSSICRLTFLEWDISLLPSDAKVSSATFKHEISTSSNPVNCDITPMANQPSGSSASTIWDDILDGTPYAANDDFCTTTGTNKSVGLGSAANADIESQITSGWFAFGVKFVDMTRDSSARDVRIDNAGATPNPTLEIIYTTPQQYDRSPSDSFSLSDSIGVTVVAARSTNDSKSFSEAIATEYSANRAIADTRTFTDSAARKLGASRSINDTKSITDSVSIELNISRSTSDTATITDSIDYTLQRQEFLDDSKTFTDSIVSTFTANRELEDSKSFSDSITVQYHVSRSNDDTTTITDGIQAVHTEAVEIPITLNAGSGSPTFQAEGVAATITCEYGGSHDGDPAQQEFQCFEGENFTISLPASTATERWIWSNGSTGDIIQAACETGTCDEVSLTYYLQQLQTVTLEGLDAVRSISVTRTQTGSEGTTSVSGESATQIWADYGTTFTIPDSLIVVSEEDRFKSYNATSYLSYNVTSAETKTPHYFHEYNMLYRVNEEHLADIFAPMPSTVYTSTITLSNGTSFAVTYDTQVTDATCSLQQAGYGLQTEPRTGLT